MNTAAQTAAEPVDFANPPQRVGFTAEERERLILKHLPQVNLIARRMRCRLPGHVSLDDLVSNGALGLIAAIDHFDASRNLQLKTYAEYKIKGAILDGLRRWDWVPRLQRRHAKQIQAAKAVAEQQLQRVPLEEEVAAELHLTLDEYRRWQLDLRSISLARLESSGFDDSGERDLLRVISGNAEEWPSAVLERGELQRSLSAAISRIPKIEKTVLSLYFHEELTLREIAKIVGLHESRISQLKTQAIRRLRTGMTTLWPVSGDPARPSAAPVATTPRYSGQAC